MVLPLSFYSRPTLEVLSDLIGMVLVHRSEQGTTSGVIVEAEAYRGENDPASFAFRGRTKKSEMLYGEPGKAFVYVCYGIHFLLNIVTEEKGFPAAVLIRAAEPLSGILLMKDRRRTQNLQNLCSGPAKLCQAFAIDLSLNGVSLYSSRSPLLSKTALLYPSNRFNFPHQEVKIERDEPSHHSSPRDLSKDCRR